MPSKVQKIYKKIINHLGLNGSNKVFYHLGRANFGDDINEYFFTELSGVKFKWGSTDAPHILGIGSIAEKVTEKSIVVGSGFIKPVDFKVPIPSGIVSVRGVLSQQIFGCDLKYLGDPVSIINEIYKPVVDKKFRCGIIPHVSELKVYENLKLPDGVTIINPADGPMSVVDKVVECENIISQSLHGLIVADAYGVPNVWVEPSKKMVGGLFKFQDYYSTTEQVKKPIKFSDIFQFNSLEYFVSKYKFNKQEYLGHIKKSLLIPNN